MAEMYGLFLESQRCPDGVELAHPPAIYDGAEPGLRFRSRTNRQEPFRRDDSDVRIEKSRKSFQEWCAKREAHAATPTSPGASGEAA